MIDWIAEPVNPVDKRFLVQAQEKQNQLTKPQGSLGELENVAVIISSLQQTQTPNVDRAEIIIYAADHGIAKEDVSAFPQAVTAEMVKNFSAGGAAISVLSKQHDLSLQVINLGLIIDLPKMKHVEHQVISQGTKSFLQQQAMSEKQIKQAFYTAKKKVDRAGDNHCQLLIFGEMGIGNTSSASALVCALELIEPEVIIGLGTGINPSTLEHKIQVIKEALNTNKQHLNSPLGILQTLGGYEIAALTASYIRSAQRGIIALVDGFICSVAALFAIRIKPECKPWLIFSHQSAELGHKKVLEIISARPLLQFKLRLGEGSGAALVYPLIRSACLLQNEMASFSRAGVSEKLS